MCAAALRLPFKSLTLFWFWISTRSGLARQHARHARAALLQIAVFKADGTFYKGSR
jgi:hypothetical protein